MLQWKPLINQSCWGSDIEHRNWFKCHLKVKDLIRINQIRGLKKIWRSQFYVMVSCISVLRPGTWHHLWGIINTTFHSNFPPGFINLHVIPRDWGNSRIINVNLCETLEILWRALPKANDVSCNKIPIMASSVLASFQSVRRVSVEEYILNQHSIID